MVQRLRNCLAVPPLNIVVHNPAIPFLGIYSGELKTVHTKTCTQMLIVVMVIMSKKWKQPESPSWMNVCTTWGLATQWNLNQP